MQLSRVDIVIRGKGNNELTKECIRSIRATTEPTEALMLGGHIAVIDEGRILQTGSTAEVYRNPATLKVAEVFSDPPINYLKGIVLDNTAQLGDGIQIPLDGHLGTLQKGEYIFGVRSNHLFLNRADEEDAEIKAIVELAEINGSETFIHMKHADTQLVVQEDGIHPHRIGLEIAIYVSPCCFFVYDSSGELVASPSQVTIQERLR